MRELVRTYLLWPRGQTDSQTCKYETINKKNPITTVRLWVLLISSVSSSHNLPPFLRESPYLAAVHTRTLSASAVHFKDTWKSIHIRLWPYITKALFEVAFPQEINTQWGPKNIFFSTAVNNAHVLPGEVLAECKTTNQMCLINLDLETQRSFARVDGHVCHWWNTVTANIC